MNAVADASLAGEALFAAARFRLKSLPQKDCRDLIDAMMYQDIWYDAFLLVLDPQLPWPDGAAPAIEKTLQHFALPMPHLDEANRILIERLLRPIAEGRIDPIGGLNDFMDRFFWEYRDPENPFGESLGIDKIVMLHYQLDDWHSYQPGLLSDPAFTQQLSTLKVDIVRAAQAWLDGRSQLTGVDRKGG